jgi:serine/threonine protein kinase
MEERDVRMFQNEVDVMARLDHNNLTKMFGYYEDHQRFMLIIELVEGKDLFDAVSERGGKDFNDMEQGYLLKQLVSATKHMHDNNLIHRDIKPENIIV